MKNWDGHDIYSKYNTHKISFQLLPPSLCTYQTSYTLNEPTLGGPEREHSYVGITPSRTTEVCKSTKRLQLGMKLPYTA